MIIQGAHSVCDSDKLPAAKCRADVLSGLQPRVDGIPPPSLTVEQVGNSQRDFVIDIF